MPIIGNGQRYAQTKYATEKDFEEDVVASSKTVFPDPISGQRAMDYPAGLRASIQDCDRIESRDWAVLSFSKRKPLESDLNNLWSAGVPLSGKIMGEKEKHVPIFLE